MNNVSLQTWQDLLNPFTDNSPLIESSWASIIGYYTKKNRAYHNLDHIDNMLQQAALVEASIADFPTLLLSIWFHDIIYNPMRKDNELKSAEFASS